MISSVITLYTFRRIPTWLIHFLTLLAAASVLPTIPVAHPAEEEMIHSCFTMS